MDQWDFPWLSPKTSTLVTVAFFQETNFSVAAPFLLNISWSLNWTSHAPVCGLAFTCCQKEWLISVIFVTHSWNNAWLYLKHAFILFLQPKQVRFPQPSLSNQVLQALHHLCSPPLPESCFLTRCSWTRGLQTTRVPDATSHALSRRRQ